MFYNIHFLRSKSFIFISLTIIILAGSSFLFFHIYRAHAAGFVVDSNLDTSDATPGDGVCDDGGGNCTLSAAVQESNALAGADVITFDAPMTITSASSIAITEQVTIDGTSGGAIGNCLTKELGVVLDGGAFDISSGSGSIIKGFVFQNVGVDTVTITSSGSGNQVACNMFGLTQDGTALANVGSGGSASVHIHNSDGNIIGGENAGDGNIMTGNLSGVSLVSADNTEIYGNIIGLDSTGSVGFSELYYGIKIEDSDGTIIGGDSAEKRNVISGVTNNEDSVAVSIHAFSDNTTIQGNYFGTDVTGLIEIPNGINNIVACNIFEFFGCTIGPITNITIGGSGANEGNIFGSLVDGNMVSFYGDTISGISIKGNYFGIGSDQATLFSSTDHSEVTFLGSQAITVGGSGAGEGNVFSGALSAALIFQTSEDVTILGNIFGFLPDGITSTGYFLEETINLENTTNIAIGESTSGGGNLFNANRGEIGLISGSNNTGVSIQNNTIGLDLNGNVIPSTGFGISLGASEGIIGGTGPLEGNIIAGFEGPAGVVLVASEDMSVIGNDIHDNSRGVLIVTSSAVPVNSQVPILQNNIYNNDVGIDLAEDVDSDIVPDINLGTTPNDPLDSDTGPNDYMNHPVILKTVQSGSDAVVTYMLDVPVQANPYHVEFFTNPSGLNSSGFGEGEVYEDADEVTIATGGQQVFTKTLADVDITDGITATVTNCTNVGCTTFGGTSEFSNSAPFGIDRGTATGSETALEPSGAYHVITDAYLGICVNADDATSADSDGPNQSGSFAGTGPCTDDRDGVTLASSYAPNATTSIPVSVSANGYVNIWIDANNNGSFQDSGEQIAVNASVTTGSNSVAVTVPSTVGTHAIRFRYTTYEPDDLLPIGEALDGEVEDYTITVVPGSEPTSTSGGSRVVGKISSTPIPSVTPLVPKITTPPSACPVFTQYYKTGDQGGGVSKIQAFLNTELGLHLGLDGKYGPQTTNAVHQFQQKYFDYIIKPWNPPQPMKTTGRWYKTTAGTANILSGCEQQPVTIEDNGKVWSFSGVVKK